MKLPGLATTPQVDTLLSENCPVAIGLSGGKDSTAVAIATIEHLQKIKHFGPVLFIHSDLGRTEWKQSQAICEDVADRLGYPLVTVRRQAGDMMDRWLTRWKNNVERYINLECVKLILPWSTPSMRFCTSELKTAVICRELVRRFSVQSLPPILSASGIRRQESRERAKAPIIKAQPKLTSVKYGTRGYDWHPILDWTLDDVLGLIKARGFPMHEAYTTYGASRVSCAFCIMSSQADLKAAAGCDDNADLYREMCQLELDSTFAFQSDKWLCDVDCQLLTSEQRERIPYAKAAALERTIAEDWLPKHLLYEKGWPTAVPTINEANDLAEMRRRVAAAVGLTINYTTGREVRDRYKELISEKAQRA